MGELSLGKLYEGRHVQSRLKVQITIISKRHVFESLFNEDRLRNMLQISNSMIHLGILPTYDQMHDSKNFYIINAEAKLNNLIMYS